MTPVCPVILCGGSGTRLWPLSRAGFPKQFLALQDQTTLFQNTVKRLLALDSEAIRLNSCIVVTHEDHRFIALEQLREMQVRHASLILEPVGRNTAAALTLAALHATHDDQDAILVTSPSDHFVADEEAFVNSLRKAVNIAEKNAIAVMGISPQRAETGYGYIQFAQADSSSHAQTVLRFVEKPSVELAEHYVASGDYAWNGGIFVLKASVWLRALGQYRADILRACESAWRASKKDDLTQDLMFIRPNAELFHRVPADSIDYAVMEKCPGSEIAMEMVGLNAGWSDLGAWDAVWQVGQADAYGNVCQGDVLLHEAHDNLIHSTSRLVSVVGVSNLAIIETADAVLVADKVNSQQVKNVVAQLSQAARQEHIAHRKARRPWGWCDFIDQGEHFKVRRICVKPGASLSLQKHSHRAEHWIIVKGQAKVQCGEAHFFLLENQSTYIPRGEIHQLTNTGTGELEMIEVQSGEQLSEEDIIRLN